MHEEQDPRTEQFKKTRDEFEQLKIEDKAVFLLEATVSTLARGVETFARGITDEIEKAFRRAEAEAAAHEAEAEAEAEEGLHGDMPGPGAPAPNVTPDEPDHPDEDLPPNGGARH